MAFHAHWSGGLARKSDGDETERSGSLQTRKCTLNAACVPAAGVAVGAAAGAVAGAVAAGAAAPGSILGLAAWELLLLLLLGSKNLRNYCSSCAVVAV